MRWLAYIGITAFLLFFALGYSYFYPSSSPISSQGWFANTLVPKIDSWLVSDRSKGAYSGHVLWSRGQLKFKSDSDFVFYPARNQQRFYGKTMVASGPNTEAEIEVAEGVLVQLQSSSALVIEPQIEGRNEGPVIRVIGGAAVAKAKEGTKPKVRVVSSNGKSKVVDPKGVAVVADGAGYIGELPKDIKQLRDQYAKQSEQELIRQRLLKEEAARVEARKQQELAAKLKEDLLIKVEEVERAPAAEPEAEKAVAIKIPERIKKRKFNSALVGSTKDAPKTSVAKGLFEAKRGNQSQATRSFASALSSPLYGAKDRFGPSVQVALDGLLESYELNGKCSLAKETISNAARQYSSDPQVLIWSRAWQVRLNSSKTCSK